MTSQAIRNFVEKYVEEKRIAIDKRVFSQYVSTTLSHNKTQKQLLTALEDIIEENAAPFVDALFKFIENNKQKQVKQENGQKQQISQQQNQQNQFQSQPQQQQNLVQKQKQPQNQTNTKQYQQYQTNEQYENEYSQQNQQQQRSNSYQQKNEYQTLSVSNQFPKYQQNAQYNDEIVNPTTKNVDNLPKNAQTSKAHKHDTQKKKERKSSKKSSKKAKEQFDYSDYSYSYSPYSYSDYYSSYSYSSSDSEPPQKERRKKKDERKTHTYTKNKSIESPKEDFGRREIMDQVPYMNRRNYDRERNIERRDSYRMRQSPNGNEKEQFDDRDRRDIDWDRYNDRDWYIGRRRNYDRYSRNSGYRDRSPSPPPRVFNPEPRDERRDRIPDKRYQNQMNRRAQQTQITDNPRYSKTNYKERYRREQNDIIPIVERRQEDNKRSDIRVVANDSSSDNNYQYDSDENGVDNSYSDQHQIDTEDEYDEDNENEMKSKAEDNFQTDEKSETDAPRDSKKDNVSNKHKRQRYIIYVCGIDNNQNTVNRLYSHFSHFGYIKCIQVLRQHRYALIEYFKIESAFAAINSKKPYSNKFVKCGFASEVDPDIIKSLNEQAANLEKEKEELEKSVTLQEDSSSYSSTSQESQSENADDEEESEFDNKEEKQKDEQQ